jgi:phosphoribosylformylglycinamidine synthase PurS subunit
MRYTATIHVRTKPEVRDPQGEAILGALRSLGLDVSNVRTGKEIVVTFEAGDIAAAGEAVRQMGTELLANPVIEEFRFELNDAADGGREDMAFTSTARARSK